MKTQEIRKALVTIVRESVRIAEDELLLAASRLVGFIRLGPYLKERIMQVLEKSDDEFIRSEEGYIVLRK